MKPLQATLRLMVVGALLATPAMSGGNQAEPHSAPCAAWQAVLTGQSAAPRHGRPGRHGTGQMPRIVRGISSDGEGGVWICGSFTGSCSFDGYELVSAGATDALIGRLDEGGRVAWLQSFGARGSDLAPDIAASRDGSCVVTGMCSPGTRLGDTTVATAGGSDAVTAKLDRGGQVLWVRTAGGPQPDCGNEVCTDAAGNVLVVGNTYGAMAAGGDRWEHAGGMDSFVLKYSPDGELLWSLPITGPADEQGRGIAVDPAGNVAVAGEFTGTIRLGEASLTAAGGQRDVFVARLSESGALLWARRCGAEGEDYARGVGCARDGSLVVAGVFSGQVAFGPESLRSGGGENLFVLKLTPDGEVVWARGLTGSGVGHGCEIEVTPDGDALVAGDVMGHLALGDTAIDSVGRRDTFVARFDPAGSLVWVKELACTNSAATFAVALDPSQRVTVAGSFGGSLQVDQQTLAAGDDMASFVVALDPPATTPVAVARPGTAGGRRVAAGDRPVDATHDGTGPHRVRELEFAIPAARWQEQMALRVYFPADGGPYPLVVFCAGSGGGNDSFAEPSIALSSYGYVVLHTSYPFGRRGGGNEELTRNRVADVVLALDALDQLPALKPELAGKIDPDHIGAAGHSSGAYIAQLLAGATVVFDGELTSFRDERIRAVIQYSGQGSNQQGLTRDSWRNLTIPMLTLTGTRDRGATGGDHTWKMEPFDLSPPGNKHHACYEGGHHGSFSGRFAANPAGQAIYEHAHRLSRMFWDAYLKDDPDALTTLNSEAPAGWNAARLEYFYR